ncbi:MAG TPA: transposase [Alphaproteobacteria bacterium]|nr:transposase [Alphaproteobacteria bacterium]
MRLDPEHHHRRSIRLKGYDYTQPGAYFVTICTQNRACLFGEVVDGKMLLNDAGRMVQTAWDEIPVHYAGVAIDAFVVMPNHMHGIVVLVGAAPCGRPRLEAPTLGQAQGPAPTIAMSLPDVVHRFKTMTTKRYADGVKQRGWSPFPGRLWQRNYYEHVIRDTKCLNSIRQYIADNPAHWALDRENPVGPTHTAPLRSAGAQEEPWRI